MVSSLSVFGCAMWLDMQHPNAVMCESTNVATDESIDHANSGTLAVEHMKTVECSEAESMLTTLTRSDCFIVTQQCCCDFDVNGVVHSVTHLCLIFLENSIKSSNLQTNLLCAIQTVSLEIELTL